MRFFNGVAAGCLIYPIDDGPIENVIVIVSLLVQEIEENLAEIGVVGFVLETKGAAIVQVV